MFKRVYLYMENLSGRKPPPPSRRTARRPFVFGGARDRPGDGGEGKQPENAVKINKDLVVPGGNNEKTFAVNTDPWLISPPVR